MKSQVKKKLALCATLMLGLMTSCSQNNEPISVQTSQTTLPPLYDLLRCTSQTGPIISLHRGRIKSDLNIPDNAISGLNRAIKDGFILSEIDIARLKDGNHILFHDGVWDDDSTGKGPVSASSFEESQSYLLKTYKGKITDQRPAPLSKALERASGALYLEFDFKSSADVKAIARIIRSQGIEDQSVLIAYSRKQAISLHRSLPKALIAAPVKRIGDVKAYAVAGLPNENLLAWLGTKNYDQALAAELNKRGILSAYGMMSPRYAQKADYSLVSIIVTDYAFEAKRKAGVKPSDKARLQACKISIEKAQ